MRPIGGIRAFAEESAIILSQLRWWCKKKPSLVWGWLHPRSAVTGLAFQPPPPAGVTITQSGGSTAVAEGGATDTYTVVLNSTPSANVTITISAGTQLTAAPTTLTFTPGNWNTTQTVTVTAVDDAAVEGPHTGTITHTAASTDTNYSGIAIASVPASITDNDSPVPPPPVPPIPPPIPPGTGSGPAETEGGHFGAGAPAPPSGEGGFRSQSRGPALLLDPAGVAEILVVYNASHLKQPGSQAADSLGVSTWAIAPGVAILVLLVAFVAAKVTASRSAY